MELRCSSRIHGVVVAEGRIEIKCRSKHCGAESGTTVLHYFDLLSGELMETKRFKEPKEMFNKQKERIS
jgi:hypothetical protein